MDNGFRKLALADTLSPQMRAARARALECVLQARALAAESEAAAAETKRHADRAEKLAGELAILVRNATKPSIH